ncbi:tRNA (adenosine(37)-N6)-threonylcarbamoyltransferase complex dimerization subunit type 1 TsaB [Sphingomonas oligophenolica]|uniref:tRNA (Adenosine(37)-N6)-threonylcarbamoyltransferase complex dimerization subunit type 1 TsaB n=1 Tax=Sphingomonas oligophenolica TaxID=301154 RepID=A0A502CRY3_9SPHN|nr:tRNA (adenosine(37)-N6)-threonylcarbamoyltransferase complex dimerization subunit type 1 TsaB [Sphingomonas oligophenolica]TPG14471.1 tRNA (adenosine(37)-N6)-threonylcarbamoyltransferase complex dimerization subunit type 1 TsaB [Sphingomonas oligophenolica]
MRTLVIDTATAACSVALIDSGRVLARAHDIVGRGHAERLIPMIAELPDGGRAARILVDVGPGSFTGVRVGIAAARGLALGWGVAATGYSSVTLIAAAGFARRDLSELAVVLEGGHGEVFMQLFAPNADTPGARAITPLASRQPAAALALLGPRPAVGNGVHRLLALDPAIDAEEVLPDAADAILLADEPLPPTPIYGRAPDAKLPGGVVP